MASSSTANTTPAMGVLKAPAIPAAPPEINSARREGPPRSRDVRTPTTAAAICTLGPSRPIEAPAKSSPAVPSTLHAAVRRETKPPCPGRRS